MYGCWGIGARARGAPWGTPTWPHRSHHHRPLTASHEAKAIYRVSVNGHLSQYLCWQLLTFHIICALFLHHMTKGRGTWEQNKMQRQLKLRSSWEGHWLGCWLWQLGVHTLSFLHPLEPAETMNASYFRLEKEDSRKEKSLVYKQVQSQQRTLVPQSLTLESVPSSRYWDSRRSLNEGCYSEG